MKTIFIEGVGEVTLRKSRLAKRLILKIDQKGNPVITTPYYVPFKVSERFAVQHSDWFRRHIASPSRSAIKNGMPVGKQHAVVFKAEGEVISARVSKNTVIIKYPERLGFDSKAVQSAAEKACARALRKEAEQLLPKKLYALAEQYGYSYREVRIKAVHTRWGSCSTNKVINLSIWLMQLPDELITYVLCHELTHLKHMNHSQQFWQTLAIMVPDYKIHRKNLKNFSPRLQIP